MNEKRVATGIRNIAFVILYVLNHFENQEATILSNAKHLVITCLPHLLFVNSLVSSHTLQTCLVSIDGTEFSLGNKLIAS